MPSPENEETPVTVSAVIKWIPVIVTAVVTLLGSGFGWGVTWVTLTSRLDAVEIRVTKLEQAGDKPRQEIEARLSRIEQLVGQLVCLDARADKELCRQALSAQGRP